MHDYYTPGELIERLERLRKNLEVDVSTGRFLDAGVSPDRVGRLAERFQGTFGDRRVALMRAPGRVNIIGEHTDYNEGPVLPAAIDRDILAVFSPRDDGQITICDLAEGFGSRSFRASGDIPPYEQGDWGNYAKAAVQRLVRYHQRGEQSSQAETSNQAGEQPPPRGRQSLGFNAVIHSTIPPAAGLSSSSAFVVLSGCLFAEVNDLQISRETLATLMADAEYYVGTRGGGMDQAAVLLGREGHALYMDFADWKPAPVPLPSGVSLVVAHSTVPAPKSAEARNAYNLRAAESHMAGVLIKQAIDLRRRQGAGKAPSDGAASAAGSRIGSLRHEIAQAGIHDPRTVVDELLGSRRWSLSEVAAKLKLSEAELLQQFSLHDLPHAHVEQGFKLGARARHVFEECERVDSLCRAFAAGDLPRVGEIMNASHESCRDNYEISCRELDELVETERAAGALGARMTGAGFGGCTIFLVPTEYLEQSIRTVVRDYYERLRGVAPEEGEALIFPVRATDGAARVEV